MVSDQKERFQSKAKEAKKISYMACIWSFLVSLTGGLMLAWWEYEYHRTNSQQWMVPFGLVLFTTPVIVWFAIIVSEICSFREDVHDPENMIKQVISTSY